MIYELQSVKGLSKDFFSLRVSPRITQFLVSGFTAQWWHEQKRESHTMVGKGNFIWNWSSVLACHLNVGFLEPTEFWAAFLLYLGLFPFSF